MPLTFVNAPIGSTQTDINTPRPPNVQELVMVGGVQYRVILNTVGTAGTGGIWVEKWDGTSWATLTQDNTKKPAAISCVAVGTIIYILGTDDFTNIKFFRYDTVAVAFLATSVGPAYADASGFAACSVFPDSTILVCVNDNVGNNLDVMKYDPSLNTWGAPATIATVGAGGIRVLGTVVDSLTALCFVFYYISANAGLDSEIRCVTSTTALAFGTDNTVDTITRNGNGVRLLEMYVGTPCIWNTDVILPYFNPYTAFGYADQLKVARAACSNNPVFALENVQLVSTINAAYLPTTFDSGTSRFFDCCAFVQSGILYVFYVVDNGDLQSAASQTWIYYNSSSVAGVWSAPVIAYTGPLGSESYSPFGNIDGNSKIALCVSYMNQAIWFGGGNRYLGLTTQYLYQVVTPPTPPESIVIPDLGCVIPLQLMPFADSTGMIRRYPCGCIPPTRLRG